MQKQKVVTSFGYKTAVMFGGPQLEQFWKPFSKVSLGQAWFAASCELESYRVPWRGRLGFPQSLGQI